MKTWIVIALIFSNICMAENNPTREIAITIDDLPFVGNCNGDPKKLQREHDRFYLILEALKTRQVPATGFVIAGSIEKGQWTLLEAFKDAGFQLGNHTYSHPSLNQMTAEKYIENIDKADRILEPIVSTPKYFRYPYLAESKGDKREKVHSYLKEHQYTIAPVTVDTKDFKFNSALFAIPYRMRPSRLNQLKKRYLDYIWSQTLRAETKAFKRDPNASRQILLVHANLINSHFLGDIIDMYQEHGYKIVGLDEIMSHDEFKLPESKIESLDGKRLQN